MNQRRPFSGKFQRDRQLVQSADIQDRFSDLLLRWCEVHRAHPEPFERYFAAFDRDSDDAVYHFLWHAAALEELHKLRTTRKQISLLERLRDIRSRWALALAVPPTDAVLDEI